MKLTEQGRYSTTLFRHSKITCQKILEAFPSASNIKDLVLTDATAGNGGDTITFARLFKHVNAVEIDKAEFEVLKYNIERTIFDNYTLYNEDYLKIIGKLKQDIIYLDPPWGGPNYKFNNSMSLYISDTNIADICIDIFISDIAKLVAIKTPTNFAFEEFQLSLTSRLTTLNIQRHKIHKFILILIRKSD